MSTTSDILTQAIEDFGLAIGQSVVVYLPALEKLTMAELLAFVDLLNQKNLDAAKQALYAKMSTDDLAAEKSQLADLTAAMADANAAKRATASAIWQAVLKAALAVLLGLAGF